VKLAANGVEDIAPRTRMDVTRGPCANGMVLIEGGKFFMGSDSSHPALAWARPAHAVSVDSFCLDTREISAEAFALCTARGECDAAHRQASATTAELAASNAPSAEQNNQCNTGKTDRLNHPQNCVSFHQAARYCAAQGARLPSEAEWEFAARGIENRLFPWGNAQPSADHVNACGKECARWHGQAEVDGEHHALMYDEDDGYTGSAPIGSYPLGSTPDGVLDLIGNVFEWTAGGLYAYDRNARINPVGPLDGESHVIRGGNFNSGITEFSDPALRFAMEANSYSHGVGFRCASDPRGAAPGPSSTLEHSLHSRH
jgi:eukaryotic-like serine/threonine-protein kinase